MFLPHRKDKFRRRISVIKLDWVEVQFKSICLLFSIQEESISDSGNTSSFRRVYAFQKAMNTIWGGYNGHYRRSKRSVNLLFLVCSLNTYYFDFVKEFYTDGKFCVWKPVFKASNLKQNIYSISFTSKLGCRRYWKSKIIAY